MFNKVAIVTISLGLLAISALLITSHAGYAIKFSNYLYVAVLFLLVVKMLKR